MPPPMAIPRITRIQPIWPDGGCAANVVAIAMVMPTMPKKLPWREDAGLDKPRSERMKRTPATR